MPYLFLFNLHINDFCHPFKPNMSIFNSFGYKMNECHYICMIQLYFIFLYLAPPLPSLFHQEYTQIMDRQCGMDTKKISYILNHNVFFIFLYIVQNFFLMLLFFFDKLLLMLLYFFHNYIKESCLYKGRTCYYF
jgi:hypothetical protein